MVALKCCNMEGDVAWRMEGRTQEWEEQTEGTPKRNKNPETHQVFVMHTHLSLVATTSLPKPSVGNLRTVPFIVPKHKNF